MRTMKPPITACALAAGLCLLAAVSASAYFDPTIGRWASRDPIGEAGGPNLHALPGADLINVFDFLGWKITCCSPETYFAQHNITRDMYDSSGNTYSANRGVAGPLSGDGLILWMMLVTDYDFVVENLTVENLERHVAARNTIINNALNSQVSFGETSPKVPVPTPITAPDPQALYDALNHPEMEIGCHRWSQIIFQTGNQYAYPTTGKKRDIDGVWVPGDWAYIKSKNWKRGAWTSGLEGENVFNTGKIVETGEYLFWGLFESGKHDPQSEDWWWREIGKWTDRTGTIHAYPAWDQDIGIRHPGIGLER